MDRDTKTTQKPLGTFKENTHRSLKKKLFSRIQSGSLLPQIIRLLHIEVLLKTSNLATDRHISIFFYITVALLCAIIKDQISPCIKWHVSHCKTCRMSLIKTIDIRENWSQQPYIGTWKKKIKFNANDLCKYRM